MAFLFLLATAPDDPDPPVPSRLIERLQNALPTGRGLASRSWDDAGLERLGELADQTGGLLLPVPADAVRRLVGTAIGLREHGLARLVIEPGVLVTLELHAGEWLLAGLEPVEP